MDCWRNLLFSFIFLINSQFLLSIILRLPHHVHHCPSFSLVQLVTSPIQHYLLFKFFPIPFPIPPFIFYIKHNSYCEMTVSFFNQPIRHILNINKKNDNKNSFTTVQFSFSDAHKCLFNYILMLTKKSSFYLFIGISRKSQYDPNSISIIFS